jgi:hypothetical protein
MAFVRFGLLTAAVGVVALLASPARAGAPVVGPAGPVCAPAPGSGSSSGLLFIPLGDGPAFPFCSHLDQHAFEGVTYAELFDAGDLLFDRRYNAADGVGANLAGDREVSLRFSRVPRADLPGFAGRATGPNGSACTECHNSPVDDGAGLAALNVFRDPTHSGDRTKFIQRNTPHIFGQGGLQLVAEEMTDELQAVREAARALAIRSRTTVEVPLSAKGLAFGTVRVFPGGRVVEVLSSFVDHDLVVRPFQWKGNVTFVREFVRDASHNEIGMQGEELAGTGVDGDGDGVANELTVGDMTAMTVYVAGQPPPRRHSELAREGFRPPQADRVKRAIVVGEALFARVGCAACHTPELRTTRTLYEEPSPHAAYRDAVFPSGAVPASMGLDPAHPVRFDLRRDVNPPYPFDPVTGELRVQLYSDLRRHDLGAGLAEGIDETGAGASTFLTRPLWGVGTSAPYLHDGRATTLTEAVHWHGGEGAASRAAFEALDAEGRAAVVEFLKDLVDFKP